jgi:hypothetical protein
VQDAPRHSDELLAITRQRDLTCGALEQSNAAHALDLRDSPAERRLSDHPHNGGLAEAALIGYGQYRL